MKKKSIFFWIPKTAGTSIYSVLEKHGCPKLKTRELFNNFNNEGGVTFGHVDINYLLRKDILDKEYFEDAYKFCFVRNPWDRFVSCYIYLNYDKIMPFEEFVYMVKRRFKLQKSKVYNNTVFLYFFEKKWFRRFFKLFPNKLKYYILPIPPIGNYNVLGLSHLNPQVSWITNKDGQLLVDQVYKFEKLNEDLQHLYQELGLKEKLPIKNKSIRKKYQAYYNEETKRIVEEIYQKDIELFEYNY